jgi:hypothetical protein
LFVGAAVDGLAFSSAQLKYGKTTAGGLVDAALLAQLVEMG